ncbi:MAG: helix-turn-helix domain-containing protein, partial [Leptonema sp. (in: Bacteria)]|nr:helix-turn-helix domain-containing protein [Leptonema sp. (in: bacteria)]
MTIGSIGELLKEARQAKGYSVREVSEETHIMSRYIDALERDDYTIFPGETYTTGFLTRYGEFLGLNSDELMQQYRGMKLEYSETPLKELTEVTRQSGISKLQIDVGKLQKIALLLASIMIVGALIWRLASSDIFQTDTAAGAISCSDRIAEKVSATGAIDTVTMLDPDRAVILETDAGDLKICLMTIDQDRADRPLTSLRFVYGGKEYDVQSREGETL